MADNDRADLALLGLTGALFALDAFSSLHSSPYTAEVRGGDDGNRDRVMHYVYLSVGAALVISGAWSLYSGHPHAFIGALVVVVMMCWLYFHALNRGNQDEEEQ